MSVLIISNLRKEVVRLRSYFSRIDITDIHHFLTVKDTMQHVSEFFKPLIDVVIFDVVLTQNNCGEICNEIKLLHEWADAPILLITPYDKRSTIEKAFGAGIFDFILKPYDFIHFKARIHIALKYREELKWRRHQESNLQQDLLIAEKVQKSSLTPSLHLERVQFDALYIPTTVLGGDMYGWFKVSDHLTAVILYDVMGHGVASSLVTMSIRSLLRGIITTLIDPVLVMTELNRHIYELFEDDEMDRFLVTAIYILIDTKNGTLQYINASHPCGFLFDKQGETMMLTANTPILGLFPTIQIGKNSLSMTGWHRIILYTDGLITLNGNKAVDITQFQTYTYQENEQALQTFAQYHALGEKHYDDDITIVSITVT